MHCASLGEFEQGLPVLESIKKKYPTFKILVTFFSPSGFETKKDDPRIDFVFYLPMDSPLHAKKFIHLVQPRLALFIKYEFWHFYLRALNEAQIPIILISGIFRKSQSFFQWYGKWQRKTLDYFNALLVQDQASADLLYSIGLRQQVQVCGDTRFDRVMEIAKNFTALTSIAQFTQNKLTLVAGSTWWEDDEELSHYVNTHPEKAFILVPHNISRERIEECLQIYPQAIRFSEYEEALQENKIIDPNIHVLIIDNMGMLSRIYYYANIAYVGGGFGDDGIHNILEAAVFGKPVVIGPVYDKYLEADTMLEIGGAFEVSDALELEKKLNELFNNGALRNHSGNQSAKYVQTEAGATQKVMKVIQENLLLTS